MDIWEELTEILKEPTCIVGVGNYYKSDDAVGLYIVDALKNKINSEYPIVLNVEDIIEGYVFSIAEGDYKNVIIIDAVECDGECGSIVFGRLNEMDDVMASFTTHKLSLTLSGKILESFHKKTYFLGIIPGDIDYGIGLSNDVKISADVIKDFIFNTNQCTMKGVYQ